MTAPTPVAVNGTNVAYTNGTQPVTCTYPAGSVSGDLIILKVHMTRTVAGAFTFTLSGGATWNSMMFRDDTANQGVRIQWYWAFRGSETGVTATPSATSSIRTIDASMVAYPAAQVDPVSPVLSWGHVYQLSGGTTQTTPNVVAPVNNCGILLMGMFDWSSNVTLSSTWSGATTEIVDTSFWSSSASTAFADSAAYATATTAGDIGTYTYTPNNTGASQFQAAASVFIINPVTPTSGTGVQQAINRGSSWTPPTGVTSVTAHCIGAGGSGAGSSSSSVRRAGGAGGSYARKTFSVTPGTPVSYSIGAAGTVGTGNGGAGGTTWFSVNSSAGCVAPGGAGATTSAAGTGSSTGAFGDQVYAGGAGALGGATLSGAGGGSGGSTGVGGAASTSTGGAGPSPYGGDGAQGIIASNHGYYGLAPGGGGSGCAMGSSGTTPNGGPGGIGVIVLVYDLSTNVPTSDAATGSESAQLAISAPDTATETELAATSASFPTLGDTGAGTDTAQLASKVSDAASLADYAQVAILSGDTASETESAKQTLTTADTATGTEASQIALGPVPDSATGTDSVPQLSVQAAETGAVAESAQQTIGVADIGTGTEGSQLGQLYPVSDGATGTESAFLTIKAAEAIDEDDFAIIGGSVLKQSDDPATASEAQKIVIQASDAATGIDTATVGQRGADTGTLSEAANYALSLNVSDSMSETDAVQTGIKGADTAQTVETQLQSLFTSDTATGTDLGVPTVNWAVLDAISASELAQMVLHPSDTALGTDGVSLIPATPVFETITFAESARAAVLMQVTDSASAVEHSNVRSNGKVIGKRVYFAQPELRQYSIPQELRTFFVQKEIRKYGGF